MDITMLQKTAIDLNEAAAEVYAFADRLSRSEESDDIDYIKHNSPSDELLELCKVIRNKTLSLSFQLGCLDQAMRAE